MRTAATSPFRRWFVNGHGDKGKDYCNTLRRHDGAWTRTAGVDQGGYISGELRIDPSPCWNRDRTQILIAGVANDNQKTRPLSIKISVYGDVMTILRKVE